MITDCAAPACNASAEASGAAIIRNAVMASDRRTQVPTSMYTCSLQFSCNIIVDGLHRRMPGERALQQSHSSQAFPNRSRVLRGIETSKGFNNGEARPKYKIPDCRSGSVGRADHEED